MQFPITVTCISRRSCFIFHRMAMWLLRLEMLRQQTIKHLGYPNLSFWRGNSSQNTEHVLSIL